MNSPILKRFNELCLKDLQTNNLWVQCHIIDYDESWYDEIDEETFRPIKINEIESEITFLCKTEFKLRDGGKYIGVIQLSKPLINNRIEEIQPVIFVNEIDKVSFWYGMQTPSETMVRRNYNLLSSDQLSVFPISYKIEVAGLEKITGEISGFGFYEYQEGNNISDLAIKIIN